MNKKVSFVAFYLNSPETCRLVLFWVATKKVDTTIYTMSESIREAVDSAKEYIGETTSKLSASFDQEGWVDKVRNIKADDVVAYVKSINKDQVIEDVKQLKLTPVTITLAVVALTSIVLFGGILGGSSTKKSLKHKTKHSSKKKLTKAQKANKDIQGILEHVDTTYIPSIDNYIEQYDELSTDDQEYKYNYINEMLLKETIKLDAIDVGTNEVLRTNRKKVIKYIQDHQKRLDAFRKFKKE